VTSGLYAAKNCPPFCILWQVWSLVGWSAPWSVEVEWRRTPPLANLRTCISWDTGLESLFFLLWPALDYLANVGGGCVLGGVKDQRVQTFLLLLHISS
jgi:hypothetical protein